MRFREIRMEGGWLMVRPLPEDRAEAMRIVSRHRDWDYELTIKEYRKKRSLDANAKAWVLMGQIAAELHVEDNEVYQRYIRDVGGNFEIVPILEDHLVDWNRIWCAGHHGRQTEDMGPCRTLPGYHNVKSYIGSSDFDTRQMSRLLDLIIDDCKALGIEYLSEQELSLLLEDWDKSYGGRND